MRLVASHSPENKMPVPNLVLVFAPNIFTKADTLFDIGGQSDPLSGMESMAESMRMSQVLNCLVINFDKVFGVIGADDSGNRSYEVTLTPDEKRLFHSESYDKVFGVVANAPGLKQEKSKPPLIPKHGSDSMIY